MLRRSYLVACCAGLAFAAPALAQQLPAHIRVVDAAAAPGGDGRSWTTAYTSLHGALEVAAASGGTITEIWVAQGEYTTSLGAELCQTFTLLSGMALYGGFAGGETAPSQRPPGAQTTLRSGSSCTTFHPIVQIDAASSAAVLDGVYITGTTRGLLIEGPSILTSVRISAGVEYAIQKTGSGSITISDCWFLCNSSTGPTPISITGPGEISGTYLRGSHAFTTGISLGALTIRDSTIHGTGDNTGIAAAGTQFQACELISYGNYSDGMQATGVTIRDSTLDVGTTLGHGLVGTGIHIVDSTVQANTGSYFNNRALSITGGSIRRSQVSATSAAYAAALSQVPISDSHFHFVGWLSLGGEATLVNTRFTGGGRISAPLNAGGSDAPHFINCLFQHTTAWPEHVIVVGADWRFDNCIIWGPAQSEADIFNVPVGLTGFINHSIVRGWSGQFGGVANSGADPLLNADGTLQPGSPAIDAGNNAALPPQTLYDLADNCRIVDGDQNGTAIVDIGPFEFGPCIANCDCSTAAPILNIADFSCFLQRFAASDPWANCDESTTPPVLNIADFSCFLQRFAQGCI